MRPMLHQSVTLQARPSFDQLGHGLDGILCDSDPQVRLLSPSKITILDGPMLFTVTTFFGSVVLHLKAADYVLFGWNSCATCLTRALGSIGFFLTQSTLCRFEPRYQLQFWMGPNLYRVPIFFGSDIPSSPELLTMWQWARPNSL